MLPCPAVNHALKLSDREWMCSNCGMQHDRDKNSCKNLLDEGKDILCCVASGDSPLILVPSGVLREKVPPSGLQQCETGWRVADSYL